MPSRAPRRYVATGGGTRPISSAELTEWAAYEKLHGPLGPERGDLHAALVAMTIANANRGKRAPYKLEQFVLKWSRDVQTPEQQLAVIRQLNAVFGGTEANRGNTG